METVIEIIKVFWWLIIFLILLPLSLKAWLWWLREKFENQQEYVLLKIVPPQEITKPFKSMEQVLANIWTIYSSLEGIKNFRKKWLMGRKLSYFCIEIVGEQGEVEIYIRVNKDHRGSIQSALYAQFPQMEITETVEDYQERAIWNVPDERENIYGFDIRTTRDDIYPIKTYEDFMEDHPESAKEEKRIDPMDVLIEGLSELGKNEKIWIQIKAAPMGERDTDFFKRARKKVDKLTYRDSGKGFSLLKTLGFLKEESSSYNILPPEMKLTQKEREIVNAIEEKMGQNVFRVNIRCIYFGDNKNFQAGNMGLAEQFFSCFGSKDMNNLDKIRKTRAKIYHFFIKRRTFLRKRKLFRRYLLRENPFYPKKGGEFILSKEELATLFHPPIRAREIGPTMDKVDAKKGEAPDFLPIMK